MDSDELVETLEAMPADDRDGAAADEEKVRYFIFTVCGASYALPPSAIKEIASDLEVFPVPACPPYVPGLVNCHGVPHTVFDLRVLFESERHRAETFLVLNLDSDDVAFGCTEVDEIAEFPVSCLSTFAARDSEARYFAAMIELPGRRIPVLSVERILQTLENDLA